MDFMTLAKERFSVRSYENRPVEEEKLARILAAGHAAPTAVNAQPQRIYVLQSPEALEKIRGLSRCTFGAPLVLLFAYDRDEEWKNRKEEGYTSGQQDVSIVATHIMLQAWELGIGSCWVNVFPPTAVKEAFGLPEKERPVLLMPLGYPAADAVPAAGHKAVRPLDEVVKYL